VEPTLHYVGCVSLMVGEHTQLVETGRRPPPRRIGLGWVLLAIAIAGSSIGIWFLWERGRLADEDAAQARRGLTAANARAAAAEDQILALSADRLRVPAPEAPDLDLAPLAESLRAALDQQAGDIAIDDLAHRLVLTLDDPEMFRGDDAELTRRGESIVDKVAAAIGPGADRTLWVHGHVDDAPLPDDAPFESAWDLSAARALTIVERLAADGVEARHLAAVAFGDSRPRGKDRAKNRRIELIVDAAAPVPAAARAGAARSR
jgi:flagellar motor protein MotB